MRRMTPVVKALAVMTMCAGIAFLGLLAGGEHSKATARRDPNLMRGYFPVPMPRYPGATEYPLTDQMKVGNAGLRMAYFYTKDEPITILGFYEGQWRNAGYFVTRDITVEGGSVSAIDTVAGVVRQVLVIRRVNDCLVFPSVQVSSEAVGAEPFRQPGDDSPPVFPGSEGVIRFGSRDPGTSSRITVFVNHGGIRANVEFYTVEMATLGWTLKSHIKGLPNVDERHELMLFKKGGREATINLMPIGKTNQVRVHITQVRAR